MIKLEVFANVVGGYFIIMNAWFFYNGDIAHFLLKTAQYIYRVVLRYLNLRIFKEFKFTRHSILNRRSKINQFALKLIQLSQPSQNSAFCAKFKILRIQDLHTQIQNAARVEAAESTSNAATNRR